MTAGIDKLISELDEHKACGTDGIRPIILKRLRASICPTIQRTFSKSLAEGSVGPCVISCQMFVKSEFPLDSALI